MSLNFDLREVREFAALDAGTTQAMVFQTMAVGLGSITSTNAREFYLRTKMTDAVYGESGITWETVQRYTGLKTNVTDLTDAAFSRHMAKALRGQASDNVGREERNRADGEVRRVRKSRRSRA